MKVVVVNTANEPKRGASVRNGLMRMVKSGCAAAWTDYDSEDVFRSICKGEVVLLYENGRGYVALGIATGHFSMSRLGETTGRLDDDGEVGGDEHRHDVHWEFYICARQSGYRGLRHGLTTCFRKVVDGVKLAEIRAYFEAHGEKVEKSQDA